MTVFRDHSEKSQTGADFVTQALIRGEQEWNCGQLDNAERFFRMALTAEPEHAQANYLLGRLLLRRNKPREAKLNFSTAVEADPENIEALLELGFAEYGLFSLDAAAECCRAVIAKAPDHARAHSLLAQVEVFTRPVNEVIELYLKAIELDPALSEAYVNLGQLYLQIGRKQEGEKVLLKALEIDPKSTAGHLILALADYYRNKPEDVQELEARFSKAAMSDSQRSYIGFALGHIYEKNRDVDRSFEFFLRGNRLHRKTYRYSVGEEKNNLQQIKDIYSAEFTGRYALAEVSEPTPIFIVGMPRSGTSLIEQILANHPEVFGVGEFPLFATLCHQFNEKMSDTSAELTGEQIASELTGIREKYLFELSGQANQRPFVTDKLPSNFINIGMINMILPDAKVIHCQRSPIANCLSIFKHHFSAGMPYAYDLEELGKYYGYYQDLINHWHELLPDFIFDIQYEDVVEETENQVRELLNYCGLDFDTACLEFYKSKRAVRTISMGQVRKPIYKDSVSAWKRYEKFIGPLLDAFEQRL